MVEKRLVIDQLRFNYNGVFSIYEFYKTVEDWIQENGMEKELKKKLERVNPDGKQIEWYIECWKMLKGEYKIVVSLRALFNNVKDIEIEKNGSTRQLQQGDVLLIFNGFLETDVEHKWQKKPTYWVLRELFDKFIWKFHVDKNVGVVDDSVMDLHKHLMSFFNLYRY